MANNEKCSQEQFELLHQQLNDTRKGSKVIKVDRQALQNMLIDYSVLLREVRNV